MTALPSFQGDRSYLAATHADAMVPRAPLPFLGQRGRRLRSTAGRFIPALPFIFGLSLSYLLVSSFASLAPTLCVRQECRMSRMWPSYTLQHVPSPSGQGSKYRLYLYKERPPAQASTKDRKVHRRPALFVHGNAGSYGQVRSVASWSWHDFQRQLDAQRDTDAAVTELDWWTVDFNEDFSAFHAATLEGQAVYLNEVISYLVERYHSGGQSQEGDVDIPVLAHSMGGIVARLAIADKDHPVSSSGLHNDSSPAGPVRTLVTLSTPHTVPPAPIEAAMDGIYDFINNDPLAQARQRDVLIVSLSGGILDTQLPSEYAVFSEHWGKQVIQAFTSNVPGLWSSVDHLAMMWCDQLRRKIAETFGAVAADPGSTSSLLQQRILRWRSALGLSAPYAATPLDEWTEDAPLVTLDITSEGMASFVPSQVLAEDQEFQLLTSFPVGQTINGESLDTFVCRNKTAGSASERLCKPLPPWSYALLPPSPPHKTGQRWDDFPRAEEHYEAEGRGLRFLRVRASDLAAGEWISVVIANTKRAGQQSQYWWTSAWGKEETRIRGQRSQGSLLFDLPQQQGLVSAFRLIQIDSSLFVYDLTIQTQFPPASRQRDESTHISPFAPMLHVQHMGTGDGRWYPSLPEEEEITVPVSVHATSPYLSVPSSRLRGLSVELFSDDCGTATQIPCRLTAHINWRKSIGAWVSRYRIAPVAWMTAVFALLARIIVADAEHTNAGPTASVGRTLFLRLPTVASGMPMALVLILAGAFMQRFLIAFGAEAEDAYPKFARDLLFGLVGESSASFGFWSTDLGMTLLLGTGILLIAWMILNVLLATLHLWSSAVARIANALRLGKLLAFEHNGLGPLNAHVERPRWAAGTTLFLAAVLLAVKVALPYQVIFLAATLVQLLNVVRAKAAILCAASDKARDTAATSKTTERINAHAEEARLRQQLLVLLHLVILLPLRAPSLFIFVRNAIAGFAALPLQGRSGAVGLNFGEDHDVYRLAPVLLLVQVTSTGRLLEVPRAWPWAATAQSSPWWWSPTKVIRGAYFLLAIYTIAWGGRYPYRMYDISLVVFTLTLATHYMSRWWGHHAVGPRPRSDGQHDGAEQGQDIALISDDTTSSRNARPDPGQDLRDAEVLPFSIPDSLLASEVADPLEASGQDSAAATERGAEGAPAESIEPKVLQSTQSKDVIEGEQGSGLALAASDAAVPADTFLALLTRYLEVLDWYLALRNKLSQTLSQGHISLSAAQMGSGGWGFDSANPFVARRRLLLRETADLRREIEVNIDFEHGSDQRVTLQLADVQPTEEEEGAGDDDEARAGLDSSAKDGATASTALAPSDRGEHDLRRRRQGAASSADDPSSNASEKPSTDDEDQKGKSSAEASDRDEEGAESKRPSAPPSVLHRLSPLPSANLRKTQERFRQALGCIVGPGQDSDAQVSGDGGDAPGEQRRQLGLVPLMLEMSILEAEIRQARRDLGRGQAADRAA